MEIRDFFLLLTFFLFLTLIMAQSSGWVSIYLNVTQAWWNDSIKAYGKAFYDNGTPVAGAAVKLEVGDTKYTCPLTDSEGNWECRFQAPLRIGSYMVKVNITDSAGESFINTTTLKVIPNYGEKPIGSVERVVYEVPMIMQELTGEIRKVTVRIMVWKG